MSDTMESWPMVGIEAPLANDVCYGRGGRANNHEGNCRFRVMVCEYKDEYAKCSRHEKTALAERLVRKWRNQTPPGRFIREDKATGLWYDVGEEARAKISQTLREGPLKEEGPTVKKASCPKKNDCDSQSVPPPPPKAEHKEKQSEICVTPPQSRPTAKDLEVEVSPTSVMDRTFYDIETVEKATKLRSNPNITNFFKGVRQLPGLGYPRRQKSKRATSEESFASDDYQPPAKRHAHQPSPFSSFFHDLVQEKMTQPGSKTFTLVQDNAVSVPEPSVAPVSKVDIVLKRDKAQGRTTPCISNRAAPAAPRKLPTIRRYSISKDIFPEMDKMPKDFFDPELMDRVIEQTWMDDGFDLDLVNDPIFNNNHSEEEGLKKESNHSSRSVRTMASTVDSIMEDMSALLVSSVSGDGSALREFEKANPDLKPHQFRIPDQLCVPSLPKQVSVPTNHHHPNQYYTVPQPEPDPMDYDDDDLLSLASLDDCCNIDDDDYFNDVGFDACSRYSRMSVLSMESATMLMRRTN